MPSSKTIAIPLNPGARRGKRAASPAAVETVHDDAVAVSPLRKPARAVAAHPAHRYHAGERLRMAQGGYSVVRAGAFCKVTALLPYEGHGALLYRVRSETEQFERVVAEGDLSRKLDET